MQFEHGYSAGILCILLVLQETALILAHRLCRQRGNLHGTRTTSRLNNRLHEGASPNQRATLTPRCVLKSCRFRWCGREAANPLHIHPSDSSEVDRHRQVRFQNFTLATSSIISLCFHHRAAPLIGLHEIYIGCQSRRIRCCRLLHNCVSESS